MTDRPNRIDRRTFLRGVAVVGAGALGADALAARSPAPLRIGVVEVASERRPQLAAALRRGVDAGLSGATLERPIEVLTAVSGPTPSRLAAAIERLSDGPPLSLLIAPVGPAAAQRLAPLLARLRTPLLALSVGADSVRSDEAGPWIVHHTLQQWQASWALGALAAQSGDRIAVATSVYAGGFDHLYAFRSAATAHGASAVETVVSDAGSGRHDLAATLAALERLRPHALYLLYDDPFAQTLAAAVAERAPLAQTRLLATGVTTGVPAGAAARTARVVAWSPRLDQDANWTYLARSGRPASGLAAGFSLLGYEGAQLALALLGSLGERPGAQRLASTLPTLAPDGPRGHTRWVAAARRFDAPLYLEAAGAPPTRLTGAVDEGHPALRALHRAPRSGWLTDYPFL